MSGKWLVKDLNLSATDEDEEENGGRADSSATQRQRKRPYQRHTTEQIKRLKENFNGCPHPDKRAMAELADELGLTATQVKFWFQNKRSQMKAKQETREKRELQAENDRLREENTKHKEALESAQCPTCGRLMLAQGIVFDDCRSRMEHTRLMEKYGRITTITTRLFGKPVLSFNVDSSSSSRDA